MDYSALENLKDKDVKRFTLKGEKQFAKVVSIFDGDTLDLAFYREDNLVRYKCRMSGYDAPEMDEENGKLARDYLAHLCTEEYVVEPVDFKNGILSKDQLQTKLDENKTLVIAEFGREGKYGRPVVTLYKIWTTGSLECEKSLKINDMMTKFVQKLDLQVTSETSSDDHVPKLVSSDSSEASSDDHVPKLVSSDYSETSSDSDTS